MVPSFACSSSPAAAEAPAGTVVARYYQNGSIATDRPIVEVLRGYRIAGVGNRGSRMFDTRGIQFEEPLSRTNSLSWTPIIQNRLIAFSRTVTLSSGDSLRHIAMSPAGAYSSTRQRSAVVLMEGVSIMSRSSVVVILVMSIALLVVGSAVAQDKTPDDDPHSGHNADQTAATPYAGRYDPNAVLRSLTPDETAQIQRGEGAGFALPAELNGVPGPRHVLDLAEALALTADQRAAVEAIAAEMTAAVIPAGERYLAALQSLETAFREGSVTEADLAHRVLEVYRLEGELAAAHLIAHLQTAALLTPAQIATYNRLRGYE